MLGRFSILRAGIAELHRRIPTSERHIHEADDIQNVGESGTVGIGAYVRAVWHWINFGVSTAKRHIHYRHHIKDVNNAIASRIGVTGARARR